MKKIKKRSAPRSKRPKKYNKFDEEISEDEDIFDDLDTKRNIKGNKNNEGGELWKYIYENYPDGVPAEEGHETTGVPSINGNEECEDEEIKSENEFSVDRLEGSADLTGSILEYDQIEDNDPSYNWITQSSESNETYKRLVRKFKQVEVDVPEVLKSESQAKARRLERKTQYESVKKHLTKKWAPIVAQINKTEAIVYGEDTDRSDATCGTLYSTFKPETEFEKELAKSTDESLKLIEGKALAKAILAREQKKSKRINRIKSKRWHKRQKQRDLEMAAKLLTKIDDPELANEIKTTFEKKRAEKRILRKKEAQSKWAKMALRYGGKDLLKEISFQNQNLKNDHQLIDEVTKYEKENEDDVNYDDTETSEDEENEYKIRETNQDKLNVILDSSVPIPEKGLFNLTFMKNAIENKRLQEHHNNQKNDTDEEEEYDDNYYEKNGNIDDYNKNSVSGNISNNNKQINQNKKCNENDNEMIDYNIIISNEGVEVDSQIIKLNKLKESKIQEFSKKEIEKAREELNKKIFSNQFSEFNKVEDKTTTKIKNIAYDTSIFTDKSNTQTDLSDQVETSKNKIDHKDKDIIKNNSTNKNKNITEIKHKDTSNVKLKSLAKDRDLSNDKYTSKDEYNAISSNKLSDVDDNVDSDECVNKSHYQHGELTDILEESQQKYEQKQITESVNYTESSENSGLKKRKLNTDETDSGIVKKQKALNLKNDLDKFIDSIHVSKENENEKYVKEMFVTRPEDENYIEDSENEQENADGNDKKSMAGWGTWTGYGIEDKQKKKKEQEEKNKEEKKNHKRPRVKISKKKDPKLSKYYIHNLPHPFNNRHEYNSKMEIPIGPEWNTINMHKKLIQPKTSVKIGSVIMPLGLGNSKHKQLIRDFGKKVIKNRTHSRL